MPGWARLAVRVGWAVFGLALVALAGLGWVLWHADRDRQAACAGVGDEGVVVATAYGSDLECEGSRP